jgi:hypothetical protein
VTIFYGGVRKPDEDSNSGSNRHQVVEIKSGGGFLSHDAPIAHFGLGALESIERIEVSWSTGETTSHVGPFPADVHYRVERRRGGA